MSIPGHQTVLDEFLRWESQSMVEAVATPGAQDKLYFMPVENIKTYFARNNGQKLTGLLTEIFKSKFPPIDYDLILRDHTAIFCILLHLGQAKQIEHFARYEELSDRRLPFEYNHPPREFPVLSDPNFLYRFCQEQTVYCVPQFESHMLHKHFGQQRLLPITSCREQGQHGVSNQYVVTVYEPHNKLLPPGSDMSHPYSNTFVLKTYSKTYEAQYKQEVDGFRNVRHTESIISFYGSFIHGDSFNILLEYPDKGSLEEYFRRETPPSRGSEIIKFWEALFLLIKGLKAIHSVRLGHYDIKPEGILIIGHGSDSPPEWQFKFADVGVSDSKTSMLDSTQANPSSDRNICSTYGPPELYSPSHDDQTSRKRSSKINSSADIWALGCIFSEAAVWIADGYRGLLNYRQQRTAESDRILFKGGDCFHDGERVLQSVLDVHADIEDRLRRSDHITKDALDTMVDEMLWDEDRPNAKALWRKAEMVLSRARQKLTINSIDEISRPESSQSRAFSLPKTAPPTLPLPALPRGAQAGLSSISEIQYPPNVEKWRSQVGQSRISSISRSSGLLSEISSPLFQSPPTVKAESVSELEKDGTGSTTSWNLGDNASSIASPITAFSSPHISLQLDYKQTSVEGRPRVLQRQSSYEYKSPPRKTTSHSSTSNYNVSQNNTFMLPPPLAEHPAYIETSATQASDSEWNSSRAPGDTQLPQPTPLNGESESHQATRINSRNSSISSHPSEPVIRPKSQKRPGGFSLFPSRNWSNATSSRPIDKSKNEATPRSLARSSISSSAPSLPTASNQSQWQPQSPSFEYLSLNTCLEWKRAHKKVKKSSKVPPLPGAHMLEDLNDRDHIFIIDDSASMSSIWPDVKRVFETLSYVVKGMSPSGTELFFTVSYDTYRRKDTSELCGFLDNKACKGETNISYRLNLQLQGYRLKLQNSKFKKGKDSIVRPMSFYILTNGEWGAGADPKVLIKATADYLIAEGYTNKSQVTIEFISFATSSTAMQKINDLAQMDFGLDIVDCTRWTGNVLKMLKGPMDKSLFDHDNQNGLESRGPNSPSGTPLESMDALVYAKDVINELA